MEFFVVNLLYSVFMMCVQIGERHFSKNIATNALTVLQYQTLLFSNSNELLITLWPLCQTLNMYIKIYISVNMQNKQQIKNLIRSVKQNSHVGELIGKYNLVP